MKKDQLRLKGTIPLIVGMCLMLAPLELVFGAEVGNLLDFFGFLLIMYWKKKRTLYSRFD